MKKHLLSLLPGLLTLLPGLLTLLPLLGVWLWVLNRIADGLY